MDAEAGKLVTMEFQARTMDAEAGKLVTMDAEARKLVTMETEAPPVHSPGAKDKPEVVEVPEITPEKSKRRPKLDETEAEHSSQDIFHDDAELCREEQLALRDDMNGQEGENAGSDQDFGEAPPKRKKPGAKAKAKGKAKASPKKGKAKAKAKASPKKGKAKAKAKASPKKGKAKAKAKASPKKAKAKAKASSKKARKLDLELQDDADEPMPNDEQEAKMQESKPAASDVDGAAPAGQKRKTAPDDGPAPAAVAGPKVKATFARRYKPAKDIAAARRWTLMKEAYELLIAPKLLRPLSQEVGVF